MNALAVVLAWVSLTPATPAKYVRLVWRARTSTPKACLMLSEPRVNPDSHNSLLRGSVLKRFSLAFISQHETPGSSASAPEARAARWISFPRSAGENLVHGSGE